MNREHMRKPLPRATRRTLWIVAERLLVGRWSWSSLVVASSLASLAPCSDAVPSRPQSPSSCREPEALLQKTPALAHSMSAVTCVPESEVEEVEGDF